MQQGPFFSLLKESDGSKPQSDSPNDALSAKRALRKGLLWSTNRWLLVRYAHKVFTGVAVKETSTEMLRFQTKLIQMFPFCLLGAARKFHKHQPQREPVANALASRSFVNQPAFYLTTMYTATC